MAHITFIHGIANKPPRDQLLAAWVKDLAVNGGIDLAARNATFEMVYWADVLYPQPAASVEAMADDATGAAPLREVPVAADKVGPPLAPTLAEAAFVAGLAMNFGGVAALAEANVSAEDAGLERIPIPWPLKKKFMEAYLRDVHHYLFNVSFSPRPGDTYRVQDEIRGRTLATLRRGATRPGPHVIVSHSMGTVIAYDCLKRIPDCPSVDALITIGSPLGLDEVQDQLTPGWSRADGFPHAKLGGGWINVYDQLDPVAGFDPKLSNDYLHASQRRVEDINEQNFGRWRHDIGKYLRGPLLRGGLGRLLA